MSLWEIGSEQRGGGQFCIVQQRRETNAFTLSWTCIVFFSPGFIASYWIANQNAGFSPGCWPASLSSSSDYLRGSGVPCLAVSKLRFGRDGSTFSNSSAPKSEVCLSYHFQVRYSGAQGLITYARVRVLMQVVICNDRIC